MNIRYDLRLKRHVEKATQSTSILHNQVIFHVQFHLLIYSDWKIATDFSTSYDVLATENEKSLTDTIAAFPPPGRTVLIAKPFHFVQLLASRYGYISFSTVGQITAALWNVTKASVIALVTQKFIDDMRCKWRQRYGGWSDIIFYFIINLCLRHSNSTLSQLQRS